MLFLEKVFKSDWLNGQHLIFIRQTYCNIFESLVSIYKILNIITISVTKTHYYHLYHMLLRAYKKIGFRFCTIARERMDYDVVIVGGGVAGLSTAIKLKQ